MKYLYAMSIQGQIIHLTAKYLRIERQKLNPIDGGSFVSIAYYQTDDGKTIGLIF